MSNLCEKIWYCIFYFRNDNITIMNMEKALKRSPWALPVLWKEWKNVNEINRTWNNGVGGKDQQLLSKGWPSHFVRGHRSTGKMENSMHHDVSGFEKTHNGEPEIICSFVCHEYFSVVQGANTSGWFLKERKATLNLINNTPCIWLQESYNDINKL